MKKQRWVNFKIAGIVFLLIGSLPLTADFPKENILRNSGFEESSGWNSGNIKLVSEGLNGTRCVSIKSDVPSGANGFRGVVFQDVKNPPGGRYIFSGYVRSAGLHAVYLCVDCKPETKPCRKFYTSRMLEKTAAKGWMRFVVPVEIPAGRQSVRVIVQLFAREKNRILMLDDVSFVHQREGLGEKE